MNAVSDYFTLFGLKPAYTQDKMLIKTRLYQLQQKVHPDNFVNATQAEKCIAQAYSASINDAYQVLLSPLKRAIYLLKLHGVDTEAETDTSMPMEFLSHQLELRERMDEGDNQAVKAEVEAALLAAENQLTALLDNNISEKALESARQVIRKMYFYERMKQEIES
jgi:molecular chaperone HscB